MILRVLLVWLWLVAAALPFNAAETIDAKLNQLYDSETEANGTLTVYKYQVKQSQVVRVYLHSDNSSSDAPLLAVFREQRAVLSVQLPIRLEKSYLYDTVARTLCPFGNESLPPNARDNDPPGALTVEINSFSHTPVPYSFKAYLLDNFEITIGEAMNLSASPSQPVYLRYRVPERLDSVLVAVKSEDPICMTVSIQQIQCPVFDLDNNVIFSGTRQTMTEQAAIPIQRKTLDDFYIVFVVRPNDDVCSEMMSIQPATGPVHPDERIKKFTVTIHELPTNSAYLIPMGVALAAIFIIYVLAFFHVGWVSYHDRRRWEEEGREAIAGNSETTSLNNPNYSYGAIGRDGDGASEISDDSEAPTTSTGADRRRSPDATNQPGPDVDDLENDYADYDRLDDARTDKSVIRSKVNLRVSDLSLKPWKVREKKYHLYTWNLLTIALFYALPVVQLVLTWQNTVRLSGDMDLCWYNFLCARPLLGIFSFNSVFSNIGYVMLGLLYLMMVKEREVRYRKMVGCIHDKVATEFGIPMHNGLLYALGIAIMMEGILSASYHVCPSSSNYQFDTAFMYIIGALGMLKIYQFRHPDINANAHVTFAILASFIFLAMCGVYFHDAPFWAVFSVLYIVFMFGVSIEFYFKGQWRLNRHAFHRLHHYFRSTPCPSLIIPRFKGRFVFLLIGNLLNLGFVIYGVSTMPKDFPSFLLLPFTGNLFLYLMYYIFMKQLNNERLKMRTVIFLFMAIGCWLIAMWFFLHGTADWSQKAALSRVKNRDCILFNFYDNHDVWHFMSALSLFMSFSIFLSLDDGLQWVRRDQIAVF